MKCDGCKKYRVSEERPTSVEQVSRQSDRPLNLAFDGYCMFEETRGQCFFKCAKANCGCRCQLSITSVERFKHRIDLSVFYLITIAFAAGMNQVFEDSQPLSHDALTFRDLRQLRPEGNLGRVFSHVPNR